MTDTIIRLLGQHYDVVVRWGVPVVCGLTLCGGLGLFGLARRGVGRAARVLAGLVLAATLIAVTSAVVFLQKNYAPLTIPDGYGHQQVTVDAGDVRLVGELLTPAAGSARPGMVFLVGSDVSSYHTNYAPLANDVLTPVFAQRAYALLYYDKRGIGPSSGDVWTANFDVLAADAAAAVTWLGRQPGIDASRIVVVGHSQGGWIAQLVGATHSDVWAVASLAGPVVTVEEQAFDDAYTDGLCSGWSPEVAAQAARRSVDEVNAASVAATGRLGLWARIRHYDPRPALQALRQPTLLLFGEHDRLVPPATNAPRLRAVLGDPPPRHISALTVPDTSHALRTSALCHAGPQRALPWSPVAVQAIEAWLDRIAGDR